MSTLKGIGRFVARVAGDVGADLLIYVLPPAIIGAIGGLWWGGLIGMGVGVVAGAILGFVIWLTT